MTASCQRLIQGAGSEEIEEEGVSYGSFHACSARTRKTHLVQYTAFDRGILQDARGALHSEDMTKFVTDEMKGETRERHQNLVVELSRRWLSSECSTNITSTLNMSSQTDTKEEHTGSGGNAETIPISKEARNKLNHEAHRFGNYKSYYTHFRSPSIPDPRLVQLEPLVRGKRILDLGCNSGKLTLELAAHFDAEKAVGVDLDPYLISQANNAHGLVMRELPSSRADAVSFELFDFATTRPYSGSAKGESWDVVLLLSVLKWVHLNNSDQVLLDLFAYLLSIVVPGGYLVIEPQDWDNYKRAVKKCPSLKPTFRTLKIQPPFTEELKQAGWTRVDGWERDEFGFERSMHIWRKPL
ncbi:Bin3-domain-containing protein [Aulographum hederae CBS 113979]|uniref:RNA methyltransferase n=1 Tax=Aulographum hederae CBS 113979 TaxID=1176131 RepID=A0A6G1H6Y1_9PEZI|nr:Bin3-domain-containing protein [Aulographum hederae CBS 113979]